MVISLCSFYKFQVEIVISQEEVISETILKDEDLSKSGESQEEKTIDKLSTTEESITVEEEEVEEEVEEEAESSKEGLLLTDTSEPEESEEQLSITLTEKEDAKAETSVASEVKMGNGRRKAYT